MTKLLLKTIATSAMAFGTLAIGLSAQTKVKKIKIPVADAPAHKGGAMFDLYCATCHGADGKGNGPTASAFQKPLPDLTLLAKNNHGEFPGARVMMTLGRIPDASAHGSANMPIWGNLFRSAGQSELETQRRIYNLTHYLEILQVPSAPDVGTRAIRPPKVDDLPTNLSGIRADSGEAMYHILCAGCHGTLGRGDGPASPLLKGERLDLTKISKRNKGEYPAQRIAYILGNQAGVAGHGSKEMPVWGDSFRGVGEQDSVVRLRINNLVEYIRGLQGE